MSTICAPLSSGEDVRGGTRSGGWLFNTRPSASVPLCDVLAPPGTSRPTPALSDAPPAPPARVTSTSELRVCLQEMFYVYC